jgi:hypothetical protein
VFYKVTESNAMMNSNSFDLIMQEVLKQRQAMGVLQAENQELRQQLADLRAGRGIFIEIDGNRFALDASAVSQIASVSQKATAIANEPKNEASQVMSADTAKSSVTLQNNKDAGKRSSTFLEEVMIGEFESAMASPLTVFQDLLNLREEEQKQKNSKNKRGTREEEKKALLRRDLKGSYLLD